ncbi:hypothetical protein [Streptomyces sp. NRRL S-337]|uniref:hypothetical protein n=1 Tax=Streptomyces sp. NRRL S-337 TaxID=1463900 RepID=UPI0004C88D0E|nr:hypothetical protein [Streptomyces sp. NRRL S-337]
MTTGQESSRFDISILTWDDDFLYPLLYKRDEVAASIAAGLDIVRAGLVRRISERIDVPALITKHAGEGMHPGSIAQVLGVSESYVYRVLRERGETR